MTTWDSVSSIKKLSLLNFTEQKIRSTLMSHNFKLNFVLCICDLNIECEKNWNLKLSLHIFCVPLTTRSWSPQFHPQTNWFQFSSWTFASTMCWSNKLPIRECWFSSVTTFQNNFFLTYERLNVWLLS